MKLHRTIMLAKALFQMFFLFAMVTSSAQKGSLINSNSLINNTIKKKVTADDQKILVLRNIYSSKVEAQKELINGKEYEPYYTRSRVKPLLYPEKTRTASIITNTRRYNNITLQYDTFLDEVIYTDTSQTINFRFPQIALNKDIVDGFNLYFTNDSAIFKNIREPDASLLNLEEGFYEVAYEGKSEYYIKHVSFYYMKEARNNYKYSPKGYIKTGESFSRLKNRKSLLRMLGESAEEIKQYIKSAGIKVGKADTKQIVSILRLYDSTIQQGK